MESKTSSGTIMTTRQRQRRQQQQPCNVIVLHLLFHLLLLFLATLSSKTKTTATTCVVAFVHNNNINQQHSFSSFFFKKRKTQQQPQPPPQQEEEEPYNFPKRIKSLSLFQTTTSSSSSSSKKKKSTSTTTTPSTTTTTTTTTPFHLVIVESPAKASTLQSILNSYASSSSLPHTYVVDSCMGHVRDLPSSSTQLLSSKKQKQKTDILGVDVQNNYAPVYVTLEHRKEVIGRLKDLAKRKECEKVILATDEDREGEAIAWHLLQVLELDDDDDDDDNNKKKKKKKNKKEVERVTFNEITPAAIRSSFFPSSDTDATTHRSSSRGVDMNLVSAQETRRILDRLAGYTISPLLWKKIAPGLSAGRVQSVGLYLIVQRELERLKFKSAEYWSIKGLFSANDGTKQDDKEEEDEEEFFEASLYGINGVRIANGGDFDGGTGALKSSFLKQLNSFSSSSSDMKDTADDDETENPNNNSSSNTFLQTISTTNPYQILHLLKPHTATLLALFAANNEIAPHLQSFLRSLTTAYTITSLTSASKSYSTTSSPYTTSTLQQDANTKLGLSVGDTMKCAQILYENGYISYVRTDSCHLSEDAVEAGKLGVLENFGERYLEMDLDVNEKFAKRSRNNKKKKKQQQQQKKKKGGDTEEEEEVVKEVKPQEAHEAIRPSINEKGGFVHYKDLPLVHLAKRRQIEKQQQQQQQDENNNNEAKGEKSSIGGGGGGGGPLPKKVLDMYEMIYRRTLSAFMKDKIINQTSVVVEAVCKEEEEEEEICAEFRASGSVVIFDGFDKAWQQQQQKNEDDASATTTTSEDPPNKKKETTTTTTTTKKFLPSNLYLNQTLYCHTLTPTSSKTVPPPRYNEASFVKELESKGVGRPSTYASVIETLRKRAYVGTPRELSGGGGGMNGREKKFKDGAGGVVISARRAAGGEEFMGSGRGPLVPSLSAFVVCTLLKNHCPSYVDPNFTARMEERLDKIALGDDDNANSDSDIDNNENGYTARVSYLEEYYGGENGLKAQVERIDREVSAEEARRANLPSIAKNKNDDGNGKTKKKKKKEEKEEMEDIGLFIGPWGPYVQKIVLPSKNIESTSKDKDTSLPKKPITVKLPIGMAADLSKITTPALQTLLSTRQTDGVLMGQHPDDGRNIRLKIGRFGAYLQLGEDGEENTSTHSLPKDVGGGGGRNIDFEMFRAGGDDDDDNAFSSNNDDDDVVDGNYDDTTKSTATGTTVLGLTLDDAIGYVNLPRTVCTFQGLPITASIGPYGPYLKYNNTFVGIGKKEDSDGGGVVDVLTIGKEDAERIVLEGIVNKKGKLSRGTLAELGEKEGGMVRVKDGRFGVYLNWKQVNAKIPSDYLDNPSEMPLEEAWDIIKAKSGGGGDKTKSKKSRKKNSPDTSVSLPEPPKRPLSSYLHFCAAKRPEVAKSTQSLGDVSKELARLWAAAGEAGERTLYEDLAAAEKVSYEEKKRAWQEECDRILNKANQDGVRNGGIGKKSKPKPKSSNKNIVLPKKPLSSYLYFCAEKRPEVAKTTTSLGEVSKELARLWAETAKDGGKARQPYVKLAAADKKRYEEEKLKMENVANGAEAPTRNISSTSKRPKTTKTGTNTKSPAKTKIKNPRAPSAYMIFCSDHRKEVINEDGSKLSFGETTKRLAQMWKDCDGETRSLYENRALKEKKKLQA